MGTLAFPTLDQLIAKQEGFGTPQAFTITQANNPGALAPGSFATQHGATGTAYTAGGQPVAIFPDIATGTAAEDALVKYYADQNSTIADLINAWSPANAPGNSPAATNAYIQNVAAGLNATPGTPVTQAETSYDALNNITNTLGTGQGTNPTTLPPNTSLPSGSSSTTAAAPSSGAGCVPSWSNAWCLSFGRVGAFLLGLILIAAGLVMFKPVQQTVVQTGKVAAKAGALFA